MKHLWRLAFIFFLACPGGLALAGQTVDSAITAVTAYTDQAMVTRSATADVEKGLNRLIVTTDAARIASDTVTASVYGDGEMLGVQVVRLPVTDAPREKIQELESMLSQLETEKQGFLDAKEALSRQEAFLDSVVDFSGSQAADDIQTQMPSTDRLETYLLFFDQKFNDMFDRRREIDGEISSLEKEIERLRREIDMQKGASEKTITGIEIPFNASKAQSVRIETRYRVGRVNWAPVYRASVGDDMEGVDLAMMAEIVQTTGEDWDGVSLTVSNAMPARVGRLPDLDPWWLDYRKPAQPKQSSKMTMRSMESAADMAKAPQAEARRIETALSFEYTMPMPVTIASRQQKTQVPLLTRTIDGDFYHYTVPARTTDAYLVCEAEADRELLPGPVNVFFENRYTGRMMMAEKGPGDPFTLGLGIDRSVRVTREKITDKATETAFFGRVERDSIIREISYRIAAENLRDEAVTLKVVDHVPVSRTDRITVDNVAFSPEPDRRDVDEKDGVMQWDLALDPGATADIRLDFTVTYPRDMQKPLF